VITLKNIYKEYPIDGEDVFVALHDISLTIKRGEFSSLIGPSGSGKSTLMHIIGLLDKPTRGDILIEGKNILEHNDDKLSSLRNEFVGFVFQQFNLINKLTILENILLPTTYTRKKLAYDPTKKAMEIMDRFGIASKANSYPNRISGGQQQRVAIARSLIMSPSLILADEPTGNLDSKTGKEIMKLLAQLNKEDTITVLIVTHEQAIAQQTQRKIHIIDGGIIV